MKAKLILISIVFSVSNIFAQTDSLTFQKDIETLNNKVVSLENSIGKLQKTKNIQVTEFEFIKSQIDTIRTSNSEILKENTSLKNSQSALKKDYQKLNNSFGNFKENAEKKIDSLQQIININSANIKKTADEPVEVK